MAGSGKRKRRRKVEEPTSFGDALRERIEKIPKPTPEERAERERKQREAEELERRRGISQRLAALAHDVGARLDPFKRATLSEFQRYDDAMATTIGLLEDYVENIAFRVASGDSIFFIGPPGTGKDHLAVAVAREAVLRIPEFTARAVDATRLRSELRDAMKSSKEEKRVLEPLIRCGVLILSDPVAPGSSLTDYQADALFRIIDGRYRALRPTFITANFVDEKQAAEAIGSQVLDRLSHGGLRLRCKWESYRRRVD